jgi:pentatricopeptide repeat protein
MIQQVADLGARGLWREALSLLDDQPAGKNSSNLVSKACGAITAFGRGKQWQLALNVLAKWQQESATVPWTVHKHLMDTLAGGGQWEMLVKLLNSLQSQGAAVDVHSYATAIAACSNSDQWEQAVALLQQMPAQGLQPDAACYANAINACGRSGEWERALELLSLHEELAPIQTSHVRAAAIKACGVSGQWQQALQILDEMIVADVPLDGVVYCAAISACAYSGEWQQAVELLRKVPVSDAPATFHSAMACHIAAVTACGIAGQHEAALHLFSDMPSCSVQKRTKVYSAALTACAAAGQWAHAVQLLRRCADERGVHITAKHSSSGSEQREAVLDLVQQLRLQRCKVGIRRIHYYEAIVAMRASDAVHKADAVYKRLLTAGLAQPWSTTEAGTLHVSSLYTTAVAEAAIRTALSDMCSYTSATAAAMTAAEFSRGQQYYIHDPATDLHISIRPQQCSSTLDAADSIDGNANCSDESDSDEFSSVLQLCVTELLEQLSIVFTVDDTDGRVTVPAASLQQYMARKTGTIPG